MQPISLDNFRKEIASAVVSRGRDYFNAGKVVQLDDDDTQVEAVVKADEKYSVNLTLDKNTVVRHSCTCPKLGAWCEHKVAVLFSLQMKRRSSTLASINNAIQKSVTLRTGSTNYPSAQKKTVKEKTTALSLSTLLKRQPMKVSAIGKLPDSLFETLPKDEASKLLLFLYLVYGSDLTDENLKSLEKYLKVSNIITLRNRLEDHRFLSVARSWQKTTYSCKSEFVFPLIFYALDRHREWFLAEQAYIEKKNKEFLDLWVICVALYDGNINTFISQQKTHLWLNSEYQSLKDVLAQSFYHPLALTLNYEHFINAVYEKLTRFLYEDDLTPELLNDFTSLISNYKKQHPEYNYAIIEDMASTYAYFLTGNKPVIPITESSSIWAYIGNAIALMYEGNFGEALTLFDTALKIRNKTSEEKNIFDDPLACYYLMICYAKLDNETVKARATQFLRKDIADSLFQRMANIVAQYIVLNEPTDALRLKIENMRFLNTPLFNYFSNLFVDFFHLNDIQKVSADIGLELLKNEKLLFSLSVKEQWEKVLDELLLENDKKEQTNSLTERVIYIIKEKKGYSRVEFFSQKRLKSDSWSAPLKISLKSFLSCKCNCMDDSDLQIASHLNKILSLADYDNYNETHLLQNFLPFLIDTQKVFVETKKGLLPVSVRKGKAFLNIKHKNNGIYLSTNLEFDEDGQIGNPAIVKEGVTSYSVVEITPFEQTVFTSLKNFEVMPLEAEEKLKLFIKKVAGKVEIHSDMISGGSTLEKTEGDTTVFLRIRPSKNAFVGECFVQPLKGGSLQVPPALGKKEVFDEKDGIRYHILRDLKAEKTNLDTLNDYLFAQRGFNLEYDKNLLSAEDLLCLIDFVADKKQYAVLWPEGKKINLIKTEKHSDFTLKAKQKWFEVEGQWEIDKTYNISFATLLQLADENLVGDRFLQLGENDYIALSKSLIRQLQQMRYMVQVEKKKAVVPKMEIRLISDILLQTEQFQTEQILKTDDAVKVLLQKLDEADQLSVAVPKGLKTTLRDYQREGFEWMSRLAYWGAGACLADDMGLGKTVEAITFLLSKAENGPSLVVAPASVLYNWKSEVSRFAPMLNALILNESDQREELINSTKQYDVLITTYSLLVREEKLLTDKDWNIVCLDEAHTIKNQHARMSQVAMKLKSQYRLALTGTPLQNNLSELWTLFEFLNPGLLGSHERFMRDFVVPIETAHDKNRQSLLKRLVQPFLLRRTKAEVASSLPEKTEITRHIQLSDKECLFYENLRQQALQQVEKAKKVDMNILASLTKLRQAACSVQLLENNEDTTSSKLDDFSQLVVQIIEGGNQLLVFSQFTSFLKMAEKAVEDMFPDISFYLDGATSLQKREQMVSDFNHAKKQVFFISLRAGGLGLNLTAANYVIHLDPWWNPAVEQQATDRAYRIGQHQNVTVYHFISSDTIEEKILQLHKSKKDIADAILQGQNTAHSLTLEELKMLLQKNL